MVTAARLQASATFHFPLAVRRQSLSIRVLDLSRLDYTMRLGRASWQARPSLLRSLLPVLMVGATPMDDTGLPLPTDTYFSEYANLYDHIGMLQDNERMRSYHDAIKLNAARHFEGKVVLDVGCGTGVLSIWAAQAGARKVYAVEGTDVANYAKLMVKAHGFGEVVTVLRGRMEELELPEKVDVILSERMGYFLLRESMVQSVLFARDKWLKPGGVMYPSSARLLLSTLGESGFIEARAVDVDEAMETWDVLSHDLKTNFDLDLKPLRDSYHKENVEYFRHNAWQGPVPSNAPIGKAHVLLHVDMHTTTFDELFGWERRVPNLLAFGSGDVQLLCGWFDVRFCARSSTADGGKSFDASMVEAAAEEARADAADGSCVELSTSPSSALTHWAHTTIALDPPLKAGSELTVKLEQSARSHHDLNLTLSYANGGTPVQASYAITAEFRSQGRTDGRGYGDGDDEPPYEEED